jgi:hypothetical protein
MMIADAILISIPIGCFAFIDLFRSLRSSGFVFVPQRHVWMLMKVLTSVAGTFVSAYFSSSSPEIYRPIHDYWTLCFYYSCSVALSICLFTSEA